MLLGCIVVGYKHQSPDLGKTSLFFPQFNSEHSLRYREWDCGTRHTYAKKYASETFMKYFLISPCICFIFQKKVANNEVSASVHVVVNY